jgi:hypothetical protein
MKKFALLLAGILCIHSYCNSQSVGIGTSKPDSSSILELKSSTQGFLFTRMSEIERLNILSPAQGLIVYQNNADSGFYYFEGNKWKHILVANSNSTSVRINKILFYKEYSGVSSLGSEYWIINYDGSDPFKIPIILPSGTKLGPNNAKISPDGKKLIFTIYTDNPDHYFIYSCLLDGSNMTRIFEGNSGEFFHIEGAY